MTKLVRRIRMSVRSLVRSPGFTLPALLILAVGMTAATAIFTVVDAIVFRPLELPGAERLVIVCEDHPRLEGYCIASPGNTEDFRLRTSTLSDLGIARGWPFALTDAEGTRGVRGGLASAGFLRAVQLRPTVGRLFRDDEHGPDGGKVILLSHAFWTARYGADPSVVGTTVRLDGEPYEIVGVMPAGIDLPFDLDGIQLWTPPHFDPLDPEVRGWRGFRAIGRLADDASLPAASAELTGLYAGLAEVHEAVDDEWRLRVEPLRSVVVGDTRPVLMAFLGAAGLLLLIVCANVANLLLARGMDRRRELALRAALGADRRRLVGEILSESLLLAVVAGALAVVLALGATELLLRLAPPEIPRLDEVSMSGRVLGFSLLVAVGVTLVFALVPAFRVTRWNLAETLRTGGRDAAARTSRLRSGLVVVELALSVVLLTTAGLLTRSFAGYLEWEPGFDRGSLLAVSAFLDTGKYPTRAAFTEFWRTAEETVAAVPGVESVATASAGPLFGGGDGSTSFRVVGAEARDVLPSVAWYDVGPGYFETLGLPVRRGREITEDDADGAARAAVVNEAFVRAAGLDGPILGRTVVLPELGELELQVVGVVPDVPPMTPGQAPRPEIYWSNRQLGRPATFFLVRTRGDPSGSARAVTEALLSADPDLSLGTPRPLTDAEERALVRPRFQALVLLAFALAALLLSGVGVYAVVSYAVARRVREMGIRRALGAASSDVMALVLRSSLGVAVVGVALGLLGALWAGRLLRGIAHGVSVTDPLTLGGAAAVLLVATALATLVPARRAMRSDPLEAIRAE